MSKNSLQSLLIIAGFWCLTVNGTSAQAANFAQDLVNPSTANIGGWTKPGTNYLNPNLGLVNPNGTTPPPKLGVMAQPLNGQGLYVSQVFPNSIASRLGIEPGDVVYQLNNNPIRSSQDVSNALVAAANNVRALVRDVRTGNVMWTIATTVAENPGPGNLSGMPGQVGPAMNTDPSNSFPNQTFPSDPGQIIPGGNSATYPPFGNAVPQSEAYPVYTYLPGNYVVPQQGP